MKKEHTRGVSGAGLPKPWQDKNGNPLSDEYLRAVSKSWSQRTWEEYLESLETESTEVVLNNFDKVLLQHDHEVSLQSYYAEAESSADAFDIGTDEEQLSEALGTLTGRERQAIDLVFFCGMNVSETAREMGVRRQPASQTLSRALRKLRKKLEAK